MKVSSTIAECEECGEGIGNSGTVFIKLYLSPDTFSICAECTKELIEKLQEVIK